MYNTRFKLGDRVHHREFGFLNRNPHMFMIEVTVVKIILKATDKDVKVRYILEDENHKLYGSDEYELIGDEEIFQTHNSKRDSSI